MIKKINFKLIIFLFIASAKVAFAQAVNDTFDKAIPITEPTKCSADAAYSNIGANDEKLILNPSNWSTPESGKDVWFKFIANATDLNITVTGDNTGGGSTGGSLTYPHIALYTFDVGPTSYTYTLLPGGYLPGYSITTYKKSGLILGKEYFIRVSAANKNVGTFKLCVDNYFAPISPGQDLGTASILCDKKSFMQNNVLGTGEDNMESYGSCLGKESHSAWFQWVAANDGTLTMDITPIINSDDIDWVLYDLGTSGKFEDKILMRCAAGHGVNNSGCPTEPLYFKTGMNMTSTDIAEESGCGPGGQDGYLKYVDLKKGHTYALLVDNYSSGNNGFKIEFGGTSEFEGPEAKINLLTTELCSDNPSYTFTSTGSANFVRVEWDFGEGASIANSTDPNPPPITYSSPGYKTVLLKVFNDKDCSSNITKSFYIYPKPETPSINGLKSSYCIGDNLTLKTPIQADVTYSWTGPNGFTSNSNEINVLIDDPKKVGTYSLSISKNGCKSDVKSVTMPAIEALPTVDFSNSVSNLCESSQSYTFTNNSTGFTKVLWNFGSDASIATSTDPNPPAVSYSSPGTKTVTLQVYNKNDCFVSISKTITVNFKPSTPIINGLKSSYCIGDEIILNTPTQTDVTYSWTGPNGFSSTQQEIKILVDDPNKAGVYSLKIIKNGCTSDLNSVTVAAIGQNPKASFTRSASNLCSPTQTFTFSNSSTNFTNLSWDFGDGANIPAGSSNPINTISYSSPGKKTIKLEAIGNTGCKSIYTEEIMVTLSPNTPIISVNKPDFCQNDFIKLSTPHQEDVIYQWTGPMGFSSNLREPQIPANNPDVAGTYSLSLKRGDCISASASVKVEANYTNPIAKFSTDPPMPFDLAAPFDVKFINESIDADSYLWDFGDGNTSTEMNPSHTYLSDGNFIITLTASKNSLCSNSISKGINRNSIGNIPLFIPNTFSPNNDGINDVFAISMFTVASYKIQIFNRYGVPLFFSTDINKHWDGTFNGEALPVGVYFYIIDIVDFNGDYFKRSGSITIIR